MSNIADKLISAGFAPLTDFICRDDSDGHGPYVWQWLSDKPCPYPQFMHGPVPVDMAEIFKSKEADAEAIAAAEKEVEDMKKAAKIVADAVKQVETANAAAEARVAAALALAATAVDQRDAAMTAHAETLTELEALKAAQLPAEVDAESEAR